MNTNHEILTYLNRFLREQLYNHCPNTIYIKNYKFKNEVGIDNMYVHTETRNDGITA